MQLFSLLFPSTHPRKTCLIWGGWGWEREIKTWLKYWQNHLPRNHWAISGSFLKISNGSYVILLLLHFWNFLDTWLLQGTLISWLELTINWFIKFIAWDEVTWDIQVLGRGITPSPRPKKKKWGSLFSRHPNYSTNVSISVSLINIRQD